MCVQVSFFIVLFKACIKLLGIYAEGGSNKPFPWSSLFGRNQNYCFQFICDFTIKPYFVKFLSDCCATYFHMLKYMKRRFK